MKNKGIKLGTIEFHKVVFDIYLSPPDKHIHDFCAEDCKEGTLKWCVKQFLEEPGVRFILAFFV